MGRLTTKVKVSSTSPPRLQQPVWSEVKGQLRVNGQAADVEMCQAATLWKGIFVGRAIEMEMKEWH